jgi:pimeloyl-ACP methyl ester carboxylesterase
MNSLTTRVLRGYVDTPSGQVHYRTCGPSGLPVIAFFHQTASSSRMFELVMASLGDRFKTYAFDTPGFGQSWQPTSVPSVQWLGERLIEAIDALRIEKLVVCGHHTGGCIGLEIALSIPSRVPALSIIGPVTPTAEERIEFAKVFTKPFEPEASGAFLPVAWQYLKNIGAASSTELHTAELVDHLIAWRTMPMAFGAVWQQDVAAGLKRVTMPLQLMCSKDDVLWPMFGRACELRPDASTAIVGGGDYQPDRDPQGVARALQSFIGQLTP